MVHKDKLPDLTADQLGVGGFGIIDQVGELIHIMKQPVIAQLKLSLHMYVT